MKRLLLFLLLATGLTAAEHRRPQDEPITITGIVQQTNGTFQISWEGAIPPYKLQSTRRVDGNWDDVSWHIYANSYIVSNTFKYAYFRVRPIVDHTPPPPLKGFGPRQVGCHFVQLTWDVMRPDEYGGTGLRGTRIYRDGFFLAEIPYPQLGFLDTAVDDGARVIYQATAVDAAGNESPRSGMRTVRVFDCRPSVTLAWDPNPEPNIAGYFLYYGLEPGEYSQSVDVGNVTMMVVRELTRGVSYYFVVSAYNMFGLEGEQSNEVVYSVP